VQPATEWVEGVRCVVVKNPDREKIWLDPKLGYALRKRDILDPESKRLRWRWLSRGFVEVETGVWLPKECWQEVCGPSAAPAPYAGKPLLRYVYTVTKLNINNVPDSLFEMRIEPGLTVLDATILPPKDGQNQVISYIMPADQKQLDHTIQDALSRTERIQAQSMPVKVFWWVSGAIVGGVALYLLGRWCVIRTRAIAR
jgi:hypothetical protein